MNSSGATLLQAPPYMLGERSTLFNDASSTTTPTFRQVPFVRVSERVESGVKVRTQLRKYLKASSATQHMVAQMHLSDACITSMQPQEIASSCFASFFDHLRQYNESVGQRHLAASKAYLEMTKPLEHAGRSRKWARDVYNSVQRSVQDVTTAERKVERAIQRTQRAADELVHWRNVLDANESTFNVQPHNPDVIRAYQLAQTRFTTAFIDDAAAKNEVADARSLLYNAIQRRDSTVEEATDKSQSIEEDRLETMVLVMSQFVETKVAILQAEMEHIASLQHLVRQMDRASVIQQFISDAKAPERTHRHAHALFVLEWHHKWHSAQAATLAPASYLTFETPDDVALVQAAGVSLSDVDVIKDFVASCFATPDPLLLDSTTGSFAASSSRHRVRFIEPTTALRMYRLPIVRHVLLACLHQQRTFDRQLTLQGYAHLSAALSLLLDVCIESDDIKPIANVMNMLQTFYTCDTEALVDASEPSKRYLHAALAKHRVWRTPTFWTRALLLNVGDELSKHPDALSSQWHCLSSTDRSQRVVDVHNIVLGQLTAFVYHMATFCFTRRAIRAFAASATTAFEVAEEQRIALFQALDTMECDAQNDVDVDDDDALAFPPLTLVDWINSVGVDGKGSSGGALFHPFERTSSSCTSRSVSTATLSTATNDASRSALDASMTASLSYTSSSTRDIEEMKSLVPTTTTSRATATTTATATATAAATRDESWENLFGARTKSDSAATTTAAAAAVGLDRESAMDTNGEGEDDDVTAAETAEAVAAAATLRRMKKRRNSRKFNDQLRLARSLPLSARIHEENANAAAAATQATIAPVSTSHERVRVRNGSAKSVDAVAAMTTTSVDRPVTSRRSVDDNADKDVLMRRSSKRLSKSKSAASIDTSSLHKHPTDDGGGAAAAAASSQPPLPPQVQPPQSRTTTSSGMDQIKSIAAQMKLRRRTAERSPSTDGTTAAAAPLHPRRLERSQSTTTSAYAAVASDRNTQDLITVGDSSATDTVERASGVAALRARFERL